MISRVKSRLSINTKGMKNVKASLKGLSGLIISERNFLIFTFYIYLLYSYKVKKSKFILDAGGLPIF